MSVQVSPQEFLGAVLQPAGVDAMPWLTIFDEPPGNDSRLWGGRKYQLDKVPTVNGGNAYFSIAAFPPTATRRKIEQAIGACVVLIDDVGTKVDRERVLDLLGPPSYRIETSPANEQWGFFLDEPSTADEIAAVHDRLQTLKLCDRNGNNPVRYGRLPAGINNKPDYPAPFNVHCVEWHPERRFDIADIAAKLQAAPAVQPDAKAVNQDDFEKLAQQIMAGEDYHGPLASLAMKYWRHGHPEGDVIAILKGHMLSSEDRSARWHERFKDIERTVKSAMKKNAPQRPHTIVLRKGELPENVDAVLAVLAERGIAASIFARGRELVRPYLVERRGFDDSTVLSLELELLTVPTLQYELGTLVQFKRFLPGAKKSTRATVQDCPANIAHTALAARHKWAQLPRLRAIASAPIYLGGGRLLSTPGYHSACGGVWVTAPTGITIPQHVTRELCLAALARLREWIAEFPFEDPVSEAVMLAAMMTAPLRPSLPCAPGFVFDAPEFGSGKTTGAKVVHIIGTGRSPAVMQFHRNDEELRKNIDAAQIEGREALVFDNVPKGVIVTSDALAQVLTEPERRPRELGASRTHAVPCTQFVLITGNNVQIGEDLTRRLLTTRIEPQVEPLTRKFRRPAMLEELAAQRAQVLSDVFTIVAGGSHDAEAPPLLVGYERWCEWVQRPLIALGVADPVISAQRLVAIDPARELLHRVVGLWHELHGNRWLKVAELVHYKGTTEEHAEKKPRYWELMRLLREECDDGPNSSKVNTKKLGHWLKAHKGMWTPGGLRIEWRPTSDKHPAEWRVAERGVRADSAVSAVSAVLSGRSIDSTQGGKLKKGELKQDAGVKEPPEPLEPPLGEDPLSEEPDL